MRSYVLCSVFICLFVFSIFFASQSYAAAPQITAYPVGNISLNQSFVVSATMSGLTKNAVYKLRIALAPTGTSNYFGSTWNGSNWYNGTPSPIDYSNFLSITTDGTGAWWGDVQGEIDPDDPNFTTGGGTYDLKIGRYTQTGSTATWSNIVNITIILPPTSTPIPTFTPTPTLAPTATPILRAITPTRVTTSISYVSNTPSPKISPYFSLSPISTFDAILGASSTATPTIENKPTLVAAVEDHKKIAVNVVSLIFILVGFCLLASCGILVFSQTEKGKGLWKKFF